MTEPHQTTHSWVKVLQSVFIYSANNVAAASFDSAVFMGSTILQQTSRYARNTKATVPEAGVQKSFEHSDRLLFRDWKFCAQ